MSNDPCGREQALEGIRAGFRRTEHLTGHWAVPVTVPAVCCYSCGKNRACHFAPVSYYEGITRLKYQCKFCGETHDGLPDVGYRWPDPYLGVPEVEREARTSATADHCSIDNENYFIRGVLLIPVHGQEEAFGLGVWISQSQESFETYLKNFDTEGIGPFFGWFSNELPFYSESTWGLQAKAHFPGNGQRPLIELKPTDHPLCRDVNEGISLQTAWQYVHWNDGAGDT